MSLSFHDAYQLFISEGNYREKIHRKLGYAFPSKKHMDVERQLKRLHEKIRRQKLGPEHKVFKSEAWCKEAYSGDDPLATVYIENVSEEEEEKEEEKLLKVVPECDSTPPLKKFRVNLLSASKKQQHRRTDELYKLHVETAANQQVKPQQLSGLIMERCSYHSNDRNLASVGKKVAEGQNIVTKLSLEAASLILLDADLGRRQYTAIKKIMESEGFDVLPHFVQVNEYLESITPPTKKLPAPFNGVYFPMYPVVKLTLERTLSTLDLSIIEVSNSLFTLKHGFDGSGSHGIFHQKGAAETHNIVMSMICPLEVRTDKMILWTQKNPSSQNTQRPVALQLGKETTESLKCMGPLTKEITDLEESGVELMYQGELIKVRVRIRITMLDRKAADAVSALGGAYCDLCFLSIEEAHNPANIDDLAVTRTLESTKQICSALGLDEDGEILKKKKGDYGVRAGVMREPVIAHEIESTQSLHLLMRSFDFIIKLIIHEIAEIRHWSEEVSMQDAQFVKQAKRNLQDHLKLHTGIKLDFPDATGKGGTTTTGNVARRILWEPKLRELTLSLIPERRRDLVRAVVVRLAIVLRVVESKRKIQQIDALETYCKDTYRLLLTSFPRPVCVISPSVHKLLGHSWELIDKNGGMGLGVLSEAGLEACNKLLRNYRTGKARKDSQFHNLTDCQVRLFRRSDPKLEDRRQQLKPYCTICAVRGHHKRYCPVTKQMETTDEDLIVSSFFSS